MSFEIKSAPTTRDNLLAIDPTHPRAREWGDLALAVGGRFVPRDGGFAMLPIKLRHWTLLHTYGFKTRFSKGQWKFYRDEDKRRRTLYAALAEAHTLEKLSVFEG